MNNLLINNTSKDKTLFTPGPLTTSRTVKQAMLRDLGSRDKEFIGIVAEIRNNLLALCNTKKGKYETVLMQGSGTFGVESIISSIVPPDGKLLIIINGAYGHRMVKIANYHKIKNVTLEYPENATPNLKEIKKLLSQDKEITDVAVVHCETTTGIINPIKEIGTIVKNAKRKYFVDAMSSFGAIPIDVEKCNIDYLVSSSNKCIEGIPGFSFTIAKTSSLKEIKGYARSLSLDLFAQWDGLETNGQFRFTPPTHSLLAFKQALQELKAEGAVIGRAKRYKKNYETLVAGMRKLGFKEYVPTKLHGYIITSFLYPEHPKFSFEKFYSLLNEKNQVIYPGKLSKVDCFRIGNIGRIFEEDVKILLLVIEKVLKEMEIKLI
ncbi:MAG: 2-aminoethylphosphonate--pyruvate transaminase [Ignavibacteriales bacterium]|nr:2-aminoethylphosphonate--pyruvate transaminase [Ignavibacteriales bacterium]